MPAQTLGHKTTAPRHDMSVVLVTGSYDHEIRFWEAWSGICSRTITRSGESGQINRLAISPDKRLLAAAIHKKVNIYDIASASSTPLVSFDGQNGHKNNVTSVSFHSEGKWLVTGSEDGTIKIWDLRSGQLHRNYDNGAPVNDVVVHPNQGELISCDQAGSIKQWDLSENICTHELTPAGEIPIRSVTLASDGSCLVAGNNKGKCYVWRVNEESSQFPRFQPVTKFQAHNKYLTRCLLSPDTKYLATCSADTTVKIWSVSHSYEFKLEKILQGHQRWVWDCAFSADSAYLVTASSDHTARLWEMASGETVRQYNGHHKAAVCCALHDGAS
ncbi:WD40 repeat-like protein [Gloeophyllum trabeum ATCC 11539]|uniref:Protein LST8 homolog n=1 Tax=Gloeophyllum trabeum (strain ATCC 11539 / FP-39264 / Madison 617) TaxID=670483 RepID=S7RY97_GLOTA|nr:WD40 repeat-like protein [Gloeophyllum trabeum ATCC 11539]EPQ58379.1 WD40 repeat-like protein [Gloeophyllum trabeum ATCC 11539]